MRLYLIEWIIDVRRSASIETTRHVEFHPRSVHLDATTPFSTLRFATFAGIRKELRAMYQARAEHLGEVVSVFVLDEQVDIPGDIISRSQG